MKQLQLVIAASAVTLLAAGCAPEPLPKLTYAERPCYRTLAEVDCHSQAIAGEANRRVGFYDAPIAVEREPWPDYLF